jgi:hypothetical protein
MANDTRPSQWPCSEEQALAVFTSSGEASRFLRGQMWQVTYLILLAYVALITAPELICTNAAKGVCVAPNLVCIALAIVTAVGASWYLRNLHRQAGRRLEEARAAGRMLPVVSRLHGSAEAPQPDASSLSEDGERRGPGRLIWLLLIAVWIGAVLAFWTNLSRIPSVVAWFIPSVATWFTTGDARAE